MSADQEWIPINGASFASTASVPISELLRRFAYSLQIRNGYVKGKDPIHPNCDVHLCWRTDLFSLGDWGQRARPLFCSCCCLGWLLSSVGWDAESRYIHRLTCYQCFHFTCKSLRCYLVIYLWCFWNEWIMYSTIGMAVYLLLGLMMVTASLWRLYCSWSLHFILCL